MKLNEQFKKKIKVDKRKKDITLVWMNKIRERLKEYKGNDVLEFIEPFVDYGISEEKRITKHYADEKKKWKKKK